MSSPEVTSFSDLALSAPVLKAIQAVGYEQPSPIQAASIPHLLNGHDLLGVAQTGTGKTAAFALPLLSNIDVNVKAPQVLVLAPTRELAIQVAEAFKSYANQIKGFQVLPIYGGQDMSGQLRQLKRGPQVVVGTPGRVMDHLRRGSLKLTSLQCVVLDEADEMLRMGFIDDVEWILDHTPAQRQVALFSATMPAQIKKVATKYLNNPKEVSIKSETQTGSHIKQSYLIVNGFERKLDAITRILESQDFDAMIIFVRTKTATAELAEKLEARGYSASALNGDMNQQLRERTINRLKKKDLDILVATDVAARGIDVGRVSHVLNFDIPYDSEAYVHRIGRTGRAGRDGKAILFVAPREKRLLFSIEKNTRQKLEPMELPSGKEVSGRRIEQFKQLLTDTLETKKLDFFYDILSEFSETTDRSAEDIACALAYLLQLERPLEVKDSPKRKKDSFDKNPNDENRKSRQGNNEEQMMRYRIEVGRDHQAGPGDIVGAIMNETDIHKNDIGHIKLHDDHSTIDLPLGLPAALVGKIAQLTVRSQPLNISEVGPAKKEPRKPSRKKSSGDRKPQNRTSPRKKPRKPQKD